MRKLKEKAGEVFLKKKVDKLLDGETSSNPPDSDGESGASKDSKESKTSKSTESKGSILSKVKKTLKLKDKDGGTTTSRESDSDDDISEDEAIERAGFVKEKKDPKYGTTVYLNPEAKMTWHVLIRVIEGRDLESGTLRSRIYLDGLHKKTRATSSLPPKWKQNVTFTMKETSLEKLATMNLTMKVTRSGLLKDHVVGVFSCVVGAVVHTSKRTVMSKWVALRSPDDEEDESAEYENCGFVKVSLCVYAANDSPPHMNDDLESQEIWCGAQLEEQTIRVRMFRIHHFAEELLEVFRKYSHKKNGVTFFVRVSIGDASMSSPAKDVNDYTIGSLTTDVVSIEQEFFIPIQWPTVISKIQFQLFMKRGRRKRCLGQASIPMRSIYEPGVDGFLPEFGPAFINFYGHEEIRRLKFRKENEKDVIHEGEGSKYLARLLCSIDCVEYMGESSQRSSLDHATLIHSKTFENMHRFTAYCSFFACNQLNPLYASDNVSFIVSMGEYGSTAADNVKLRNSTLSTMPDTDDSKYFYMPWGNHKPMAEVPTLWENVQHRIERSNAIRKVSIMLTEMMDQMKSQGEGAADGVSSLAIEALDHLEFMLERIEKHHNPSQMTTQLDFAWQTSRKNAVQKLLDELDGIRFELHYLDNISEFIIRSLGRMKSVIDGISKDVQISIPDILIKMKAGDRIVGYCQIPPSEIFYSENEALCGEMCGKMRAIPIKWPTLIDRKHRKEEFPAVVHVRMWLGRRLDDDTWKEFIQPAETKAYIEIFTYQKKSLVNRSWKADDSRTYVDELGVEDMKAATTVQLYGWEYMGNWTVRNTHDMWITSDDGRPTFDDKVFELEERKGEGWKFSKYTDFFGGQISPEQMKNAPQGWEYEAKWSVDKHRNYGDKHGWVYCINEVFWGESGSVDKTERSNHKYRRRCIKRTRKAIQYNKLSLEQVEEALGDSKWEYSKGSKKPFHAKEMLDDDVRRRRFVMEVDRLLKLPDGKQHENYFNVRLFEAHQMTSKWQLRCYFLWAKDLLPVIKNSARAFLRVTFLTKAKQSLIVDNSQNPVWNETIMFDDMLIPGGKRQISANPPTILVEVRGERKDDSEIFLGRFECGPVVICTPMDPNAVPTWHTLKFQKGKTRGAVLACFELFHLEGGSKDDLPPMPLRKENYDSRLEVPPSLRPQFDKFAVQILCWGVRSLSKYKFLSVRRPFVEFIVGDTDVRTEPIKNITKDPNFAEPLITFQEVVLPSALELGPPFVINLYDKRAFKREPLVGVCHISNFNKYMKHPEKKKERSDNWDWKEIDDTIIREANVLLATPQVSTIQKEGLPIIDWWSKYYASQGMTRKAPGFLESGIEMMKVYRWSLEEVEGYNYFKDFLDSFMFVKSAKGNFDDPEEKEKTGELKGKIFITRLGKEKPELLDPPGVEFFGPVRCILRVYVVEARGLNSLRRSGLCDPYLVVRVGKQKVNLKKKYIADCVDPVFGELIEMEITIPIEKDLTVSVMDRRKILADEEIGSTTIDLENRLLTKWRATVGLSRQYTIQGELQWRDQLQPLAVLRRYCVKMIIPPPKILSRKGEAGIKILDLEFWFNDVLAAMQKDDDKLLKAVRTRAGKEGEESEAKEGKEEDKEEEEDSAGGGGGNSTAQTTTVDRPKINAAVEDSEEEERVRSIKVKAEKDLTLEELMLLRNNGRKKIIGSPIQTIALFILNKLNLVSDHVETRNLTTSMERNKICGELRMFVDIFPVSVGSIPAPLDISPRRPTQYQLRIAVFNVAAAIPIKRSFGVPINDIYVKVTLNGMRKGEKTDIHYRSLDGAGEFNWRFVLDLDFNPWERKIVAKQKTRLFRKAREELVEPLLIVQLCDKKKFRKDVVLGEMVFDLTDFKEGITDPEEIHRYTPKKRRRCKMCSKKCCCVRCCRFCVQTRCGFKIRRTKKLPMRRAPHYKEPGDDVENINLFETQTLRAWWPMLSSNLDDEQKADVAAAKKKDDDFDENAMYVMGLVEMEMTLITKEEGIRDPVGRKRKEPNHSPYLPQPHRSKWNKFWILSRMKPCISWAWHKCGIQILLWILLILLIFIFVYAIVYNWPMIVLALFGKVY